MLEIFCICTCSNYRRGLEIEYNVFFLFYNPDNKPKKKKKKKARAVTEHCVGLTDSYGWV